MNDITTPSADARQPLYFPVSVPKFVVLTLCTQGFYEIYWFYKNWQLIKAREGTDIMPVARAIFPIFFCYSLFQYIRDDDPKGTLAAGPIAAAWIILSLTWRLPGVFWLICMFAPLVLIPVQAAANRANAVAAPGYDPNARFSGWNIFWIVVGIIFHGLAVIGTFLPE